MIYQVIFTVEANKEIQRLIKSGDKKLIKKLDSLLEELKEHPTFGTGKP